MSKEGDKPNHIMLWSPQDWQGSALRMELILERDHLTRLVYFEILGKLHEEGGYLPRAAVSGVCGIKPVEAERAVERLLKSPLNLQITDDGMLFNLRILNDLGARAIKRENYSTGSRKGWTSRRSSSVPMESQGIPSNPNGIVSDWYGEGTVRRRNGTGEGKEPSKVTKGRQTALALPSPVDDYLKLYMAARAMRLHPEDEDAQHYGLPGGGTLRDCRKKMGDLLAKGHPWQLLVSLPALTDLPGLVTKPDVLLRSGEKPKHGVSSAGHPVTTGATCHAVVIDGMLGTKDLILGAAQVKILRAIGTLAWARERGVFLADVKLWEAM